MQHADEDELSSTQQVPEEVGSQNSVPLSQTPRKRPSLGGLMQLETGTDQAPAPSVPSKAPAFGGGSLQHPPLFAGGGPPGVGAHRPEVFHMENPPWLPDLKLGIKQLQDKQDQILKVADENSKEIQHLQHQMHDVVPRVEACEALSNEHSRGIQALRREIQELRTRSVSPAPNVTPNRGTSPASPITPRGADTRYDDLQIACGGWQDAKRHAIENELREAFSSAGGESLLFDIIVPFARSSFARIELNYPANSGIAERRKVQSQVLTALKQQLPTTNIEGQGARPLWFTRYRSPEERAKLRAILSSKDAISKLRAAADIDLDWRGKLFVEGHNILGFSGPQAPPEDAFLHTTTREDHSGWFVYVNKAAQLLGLTPQAVQDGLQEACGLK